MYAVSTAFMEAIKGPHEVIFKFEVIGPNKQVLPGVSFQIVGGEVREDRTAEIRRSLTVNIPYTSSNLPTGFTHPLHPLSGNEIKVYRGVRFVDGTEEYVPQGIFRIENVDVEESGTDKTIRIDAYDRSREVQKATLVDVYAIQRGINYADAIRTLIEDVRPGRFVYSFDEIIAVTPELIFGANQDNDPWGKSREMSTSVAHDLYFDGEGVCVLRLAPLVGRDPVVGTYRGSDLYLGATTQVSSRGVRNHIVVYGEAPSDDDPPVRGEAFDDDPTSATYAGSPVGTGNFYSPEIMTSEYVTSTTQANELAAARLQQTLTQRRTASVTGAVNPALEAGDIIELDRPELGITKQFIIQSLNVPLSIGGQQVIEVTE